MSVKISAVINTYNEEANIEGCLECLRGHVDEIVISDMHSTDRTIEICRRYTDRIGFQPKQSLINSVREEGARRATHEWLFILDCDERVRPELFAELRRVAESGAAEVVRIHRINYFFGYNVTGRGWPSEFIERFFRKGSVRFLDHPHQWVETQAKCADLPPAEELSIAHYAHPDVSTFIRKMNGYTDCEAKLMLELGWTANFRRLVLRPLKMFWLHYVRLGGYQLRTGGFMIASLMMLYWFVAALKLLELQRKHDRAV